MKGERSFYIFNLDLSNWAENINFYMKRRTETVVFYVFSCF